MLANSYYSQNYSRIIIASLYLILLATCAPGFHLLPPNRDYSRPWSAPPEGSVTTGISYTASWNPVWVPNQNPGIHVEYVNIYMNLMNPPDEPPKLVTRNHAHSRRRPLIQPPFLQSLHAHTKVLSWGLGCSCAWALASIQSVQDCRFTLTQKPHKRCDESVLVGRSPKSGSAQLGLCCLPRGGGHPGPVCTF